MTTNAKDIIISAFEAIDITSPRDDNNEMNPSTPLLGGEVIDSLAFINLIAALEEELGDIKGEPVSLITEEVLSDDSHPFKDVGSLTNYVQRILDGT